MRVSANAAATATYFADLIGSSDAMSELKPCPFCGGEADVLEFNDVDPDDVNFGGSCICCRQCGANSPVHFDRKENLYASWNDRMELRCSADSEHPVAWRYTCQDGSQVLMLKPLTSEQKRRGYYTGEDGEDEIGGDDAIIGPFHWAQETPLYAAPQPARTEPQTAGTAAMEGEKDAIVNLIHEHVGFEVLLAIESGVLTGVEDAAEAILAELGRRSQAESAK
jgi:Lar family restriction alleviation protein